MSNNIVELGSAAFDAACVVSVQMFPATLASQCSIVVTMRGEGAIYNAYKSPEDMEAAYIMILGKWKDSMPGKRKDRKNG